jgi:hypothetical protein
MTLAVTHSPVTFATLTRSRQIVGISLMSVAPCVAMNLADAQLSELITY